MNYVIYQPLKVYSHGLMLYYCVYLIVFSKSLRTTIQVFIAYYNLITVLLKYTHDHLGM